MTNTAPPVWKGPTQRYTDGRTDGTDERSPPLIIILILLLLLLLLLLLIIMIIIYIIQKTLFRRKTNLSLDRKYRDV